jgi:hypothetical protein
MAELSPLATAEAVAQLDQLAPAAAEGFDKAGLLTFYDVMRAATGTVDDAPEELLDRAAGLAASAEAEVVESLAPRPRVAMRLLRAKEPAAAWLVLNDSATGAVRREFRASTSSGAERTDWVLPLLTTVEPPNIYAELPAFRDPRYALPDELFEIGTAVKLRCHVDEVAADRYPVLSGWAALDHVVTDANEQIALIASHDEREVRWSGTRVRRSDLVGGNRETIRRRAWAGWSVACRLEDLAGPPGRWALSIEVKHRGLVRRARIGKSVGELATCAVGRPVADKSSARLLSGPGGWVIATG